MFSKLSKYLFIVAMLVLLCSSNVFAETKVNMPLEQSYQQISELTIKIKDDNKGIPEDFVNNSFMNILNSAEEYTKTNVLSDDELQKMISYILEAAKNNEAYYNNKIEGINHQKENIKGHGTIDKIMYIALQQIDKKMYHGQMIKSYEKDLTQQSAEAAQKKEYYSKFTASLAHTLEDLNDQNFGNKDKNLYVQNTCRDTKDLLTNKKVFKQYNGKIVKAKGPELYFVHEGKARWITNPGAFNAVFKTSAWNNLTNISRILLEFYPKEQNLSNPALLQEQKTGKVYLVPQRGVNQSAKYWIHDPYTFDTCQFDWGKIQNLNNDIYVEGKTIYSKQ